MKVFITIFLFICTLHLSAQSLYRQPSLSYLGSGLEYTKITLYGGLPYDGIGKRWLLEQIPANLGKGLIKVPVPSSSFVDAFGVVAPRVRKNGHSNIYLETDRFANLSAYLSNRKYIRELSGSVKHGLHYQKRWKKDRNDNGLVDYHPGHRFLWMPQINSGWGNVHVDAKAFYLKSKEWGGSEDYETGNPGQAYGYSQDANHLNFLFNGSWGLNYSDDKKITWQFNYNRHDQERTIATHEYAGEEHTYDAFVAYQHNFLLSNIKAGLAYHHEELDEMVNMFTHTPTDKYWNLLATHGIYLTGNWVLKTNLNLQKRKGNDWAFLPAMQMDYSFVKKVFSASLYGSTGRRLAKPLSYHFDWFTLADEFVYDTRGLEKSQKAGFALNFQMEGSRLISKFTAERSRIEDKAIVNWDNQNQTLVFGTLEQPLLQHSLEWLTYVNLIDSDVNLNMQFIYRLEHLAKAEQIPYQSLHNGQTRIRFSTNNGFTANIHQSIKSPQNLKPFLPEDTPVFHRTDLSFQLDLNRLNKASGPLKKWFVGLYFDNLIDYYKDEKSMKESGLLLFPFQEDILWNDPSLGNVRLEIGYKI